MKSSSTRWRDVTLFLTGLGLIIYEALLFEGSPRPQLLLLYTGMIGLPAFLRTDEKHATREGEES